MEMPVLDQSFDFVFRAGQSGLEVARESAAHLRKCGLVHGHNRDRVQLRVRIVSVGRHERCGGIIGKNARLDERKSSPTVAWPALGHAPENPKHLQKITPLASAEEASGVEETN